MRGLNNKILRILQNKHLYFPVVELHENFNVLPPLKLHKQQIFMLLHKFFHHSDKLPIVFRDYVTLNRSVHSHSTRNCNSLHVSSVQSTFGKRPIKFK